MQCDWFFPDKNVECILQKGRKGDDHLSELSDGRYILWRPDEGCNCAELGFKSIGEVCDCFIHRMISSNEAVRLLNQKPAG